MGLQHTLHGEDGGGARDDRGARRRGHGRGRQGQPRARGELLAELNALCEQGGIELYRFLGSVYRIATTRALGAHGVITGISNLAPAIAVSAWEAGEAGDGETARECMAGLMEAGRILHLAHGSGGVSSRLSGLKSALKLMGILEHDTLTMPLRPLTDEERQPMPDILKHLGLLA